MPDDLALAQQAALTGAAVALRHQARVAALRPHLKDDGSVVTEADIAVEEEVRRVLLAGRPDDAFLGEETGELGTGSRRWILDGIDGTGLFLRSDDRWQSLIALEVDGRLAVGVAVVPAQHRIWYAARGRGAFSADVEDGRLVRTRELRVAAPGGGLEACALGVVPPAEMIPARYRAPVAALTARAAATPWSSHAALLVASGELDLAVQVGGQIWDHAPLALIVEEAGGSVGGLGGLGGSGGGAGERSHPMTGVAVFAADEATRRAAHSVLGSG
ncbi:inositol monophosphatase family protein [Streptomyces sp. G5(2025)]|uniref:inositol monophosphatase family protein n=1 Tax=Streptomyces sp. G5(2025) TaxID=3406628 RepID=UPI003C2283BF